MHLIGLLPQRALPAMALAAAVFAGSAWAPAADAQAVIIRPPPARHEAAPRTMRPGHTWRAGYWGWSRGRYVWVPGYWVAAPGYYVAPPPVMVARPQYPAAPPARPAPVAQVIRLPADALFHFDRGGPGDLLPGGPHAIADAAARLNDLTYSRIEVVGYTDRLGSAQHNAALSRQRAETVRAMLIERGVPAEGISAVGMGSRDPVSHCGKQSRDALISCLQPDRRVEIVVYGAER
ncbi:MAG: OmpA family protein [Desulfovibrionaceae bacterium]|jgi:outer membrane protein OmpA-like peptidoglycan-associated protein|nr:OmpA family protein [Desulfovibrionaceae bacterium]